MNIIMYEFKKAITSPIIIALIVVFIAFNIFMIFQSTYFKDELNILNKTVDKFGYQIDAKMTNNFEEYYSEGLKSLNEIAYEKTAKRYKSISEFFEENNYYHNSYSEDTYSKNEMDFINELRIIEGYYYMIKDIDDFYAQIDLMEISESEIEKYRISGKAADTVRNVYGKLTERFTQLVENGEHKNLFFIGHVYEMHSLLFKTIFKSFIFEIIILTVLITAYVVNYEFDNKTQTLAYSTKRGRKLIVDKLYVSMIVNTMVVTIIIATGLGTYFSVFDYTGLWHVPISSYFNAELSLPYISWWNMSFIQYLFCGIGLIYICALLFTGITFVIARFVKNSYFVFFIFAIVFGVFLLVPSIVPTNSNAIFISVFTPFTLILNPFVWFMHSGAFTTFKYYELLTVGVWSLVLFGLSILCIRGFKREDIF